MTSIYDEVSQPRNMRPRANDKLEKSLKLLRNVNQSKAFHRNQSCTEAAPRQTGSATLSTVKRPSLVDISPSSFAKNDTFNRRGSIVGSDLSRVSKLRRLEMHAKVLEQKSQLENEKKQRKKSSEKKRRNKWKWTRNSCS